MQEGMQNRIKAYQEALGSIHQPHLINLTLLTLKEKQAMAHTYRLSC